jgi:hypothetical protein
LRVQAFPEFGCRAFEIAGQESQLRETAAKFADHNHQLVTSCSLQLRNYLRSEPRGEAEVQVPALGRRSARGDAGGRAER